MNPLPSVMKAVAFTGSRQVALLDCPIDPSPLKSVEVTGRTLASVISPGTELNYRFDGPLETPYYPGYAAVFEIEQMGSEVTDLKVGQRALAMGAHGSRQRQHRADIVPLPEGLSPADGAIARLMGVSWTTLTTTTARPADRVLILGLGIVGNLAAQLFQSAGYSVTAVDPAESRRAIAQRSGITDVRAACPVEDPAFAGTITLTIDCSGHEQAVLDACKVVRKGGEVVLLGVPWKKRTDVSAFDILHVVFHKYVVLRSGWEWSLPRMGRDFSPGSIFGNFASAMHWLATGRVKAQGLYKLARPSEAQAAYNDLLQQRSEHLSTVFDWTAI